MIYIFYPSQILGGAELLLIRLANDLHTVGHKVSIVDITNGWISENIENTKIGTIYFDKEKIILPDNAILITTSNYMYSLDTYFERSNAKLLFWTVQPYNVIINMPYIEQSKFFKKVISVGLKGFYDNEVVRKPKRLLSRLINNNSIIAMDNACNVVLNKRYGLNYSRFLPVYIHSKKPFALNNILESKKINLLWLGRVDNEFKKYILIKLISDMEDSNFYNTLQLNIIGEGEGLEEVKNFCSSLENVSFLGTLRGDKLETVLKETNIGFAMGTSALDIANRGIPTILLDFSYKPVDTYKYRWIFEAENFDLGRDIDLLSLEEIHSMMSFDQVLSQLVKQQLTLSIRCKNYIEKNHTQDATLKKINKYLMETEFSINDLYNSMRYRPIWLNIKTYIKGKNL